MSESTLSNYKLEMEDMPLKITPFARMGGKDSKMSKSSQNQEVVKTPKAKYSKTRGEHAKDIVITTLIVGIIAFVGGMTFQSKQQDAINTAVKGVSVSTPVDAPVKK